MKSVVYVLIASLIAFSPIECARRRSKSKTVQQASSVWWPHQTFNQTKNNITLTVKPFSYEETSTLFLDDGRFLATCRWCFMSNPTVPLQIILKNDGEFPITFAAKNINLGRTWYGWKRTPLTIANVADTLDNRWFWSTNVIEHTTHIKDDKGNRSTGTSYEVDNNPLFYANFFMLDTFTLPALYNADASIVCSANRICSTFVVEPGHKKEVLVFVWGKEIQPDLTISIAKNTFYVNLYQENSIEADASISDADMQTGF